MNLQAAFDACPLIAILRGITPEESISTAAALIEAGIRIIEVPINSPQPFQSIEKLAKEFRHQAVIGAGTVLRETDCSALADAGGQLMVAPNFNPAVIAAARARGLHTIPGVATPTEAFAALDIRVDGLKMFPAEVIGVAGLKAWRAVLPAAARVIPVGGVNTDNLQDWVQAGANGFGIGSALYQPGMDADAVKQRAAAFVEAYRS